VRQAPSSDTNLQSKAGPIVSHETAVSGLKGGVCAKVATGPTGLKSRPGEALAAGVELPPGGGLHDLIARYTVTPARRGWRG
jgi:hypothetical protein